MNHFSKIPWYTYQKTILFRGNGLIAVPLWFKNYDSEYKM